MKAAHQKNIHTINTECLNKMLLCLKSKVLSIGEFEPQEDILKVLLERNVSVPGSLLIAVASQHY